MAVLDVPAHTTQVDLGVFGGSGFYELLSDLEPVTLDTPYGPSSEPPLVGTIGGRRVAFIPRHGADHRYPAHVVNFRANVWAMAALGARAVVSPFACGSLRADLDRGDVMIVDQLIDRTSGRANTFFDGPTTWHQEFADPYDAALGATFADVAEAHGLNVHRGGTVVVVNGPRFSTRAEARFHRMIGGDLVNMTQAPEASLCAEAGIPVVGIGLVTDHDAGVDDDAARAGASIEPVTQAQVFAFLESNAAAMRSLLHDAVSVLDL